MIQNLRDPHGRQFQYLRLSVTERCNFRCVYCLPNGYQRNPEHVDPELSVAEIGRLVRGFAAMGFWKVRLTGGEPTTRRDLLEIVRTVASVPGIRRVAVSTNGSMLPKLARPLREAGASALNLSIDSLDPERFKEITGTTRFNEAIEGLGAALEAGFDSVKVNTVLLRDWNTQEFGKFVDWVKDRPVSVRFIELMRTGQNEDLFRRRHLSAGELQLLLAKSGWKMIQRAEGAGPAVEYFHPDYRGRLGFIAPYSREFCKTCNRLRVDSQGTLRLCLFGERDFSLRDYLQSDDRQEEMIAAVRELIERKPERHYLHEGIYGITSNLSAIGG